MQLFDRAILDYEKVFYEREFLISESASAAFPTLTTANAINISQTTAQSGGNISSDGGAPITARGVCWSTSSNPTTNNNKTSNGTGTGSFTSNISALTPNTTYYLRAYATNSAGTAYGNSITFTTRNGAATVTDIDGNVYNTITIGNQVWITENLKTSRYRNGDLIATGLSASAWQFTTQGAYTFPDSNAANNDKFGKLYNWFAVADARQLCPVGWHVPADIEWAALINYLGGDNVAGDALKEAGEAHWMPGNTGTNSSGFSAIGSGEREHRGIYVWFYFSCGFWSSTSYPGSTDAYVRYFNSHNSVVLRHLKDGPTGYSVRCIKD